MILLLILPLWLLLLLAVSGLCRAARAGDEAVLASASTDGAGARSRGSADAHARAGGGVRSAVCIGGRAPNLVVGSGETKNFSAAA